MTRKILLTLFIFTLGACSGNRQQPVPTPIPQKNETSKASGTTNSTDNTDPFADLNNIEIADKNDDLDNDDIPQSDINESGNSSGLSMIVSMLPLITGLMSGQTPDIGSLLGLFGGAGGGALSGATGLLGGTP